MKKLRTISLFLFYVNFVFQTTLWTYDYLPSIVKVLTVLFFPALVAVPLFLLYETVFDDERGGLFIGAGVLLTFIFPAVIYVTRADDHVRYAQGRASLFEGRLAVIDDRIYEYYAITDFHLRSVKDGELGASYSSYRKNNATTYSKTFAIPVFDSPDAAVPRVFLCDSVSKNIQLDNGAGGPYGFDQTALSEKLNVNVLYAKLDDAMNCRNAASKYLAKKGLPPNDSTIQLAVYGEPPSKYYATATVHFWIVTIVVNLLACLALVFALRDGEAL